MPKLTSIDIRRKARVIALQSLYAADVKKDPDIPFLEWLAVEERLPPTGYAFGQAILQGVKEHGPLLDRLIQRYAPAWPVSQLPLVDRNVLRIALFELLYSSEIPRKTAINEAVELAKQFGSESSSRFVNGVLGSVMAGLEAGELDYEKISNAEKLWPH